jgi:hypothetical protein
MMWDKLLARGMECGMWDPDVGCVSPPSGGRDINIVIVNASLTDCAKNGIER